jgi:hypothetical protein
MANHSVTVTFYDFADKFWTAFTRNLDPLYELEDEILAALEGKSVGELDGHEIAIDGSDGCLFLYGPDADALYAAIERPLRVSAVTRGGHATLRYGGNSEPNVMEKYIEIEPLAH